jgi:serine/threonine protein kinase
VIHRDVKPGNILLTEENGKITFKIADFTFARYLEEGQLSQTICGSPLYYAPEILLDRKYTEKVIRKQRKKREKWNFFLSFLFFSFLLFYF